MGTQIFNMLNEVLEIKVYYLLLSILAHIGLQTLVNYFQVRQNDKRTQQKLDNIYRAIIDKGVK